MHSLNVVQYRTPLNTNSLLFVNPSTKSQHSLQLLIEHQKHSQNMRQYLTCNAVTYRPHVTLFPRYLQHKRCHHGICVGPRGNCEQERTGWISNRALCQRPYLSSAANIRVEQFSQ
jgi:hypothetical protein